MDDGECEVARLQETINLSPNPKMQTAHPSLSSNPETHTLTHTKERDCLPSKASLWHLLLWLLYDKFIDELRCVYTLQLTNIHHTQTPFVVNTSNLYCQPNLFLLSLACLIYVPRTTAHNYNMQGSQPTCH